MWSVHIYVECSIVVFMHVEYIVCTVYVEYMHGELQCAYSTHAWGIYVWSIQYVIHILCMYIECSCVHHRYVCCVGVLFV